MAQNIDFMDAGCFFKTFELALFGGRKPCLAVDKKSLAISPDSD